MNYLILGRDRNKNIAIIERKSDSMLFSIDDFVIVKGNEKLYGKITFIELNDNELLVWLYDKNTDKRCCVNNISSLCHSKELARSYEIQSFVSEKCKAIIYKRNGNMFFFGEISYYEETLLGEARIHSIKRISDGEIFTLGDKVVDDVSLLNDEGIITKIFVKDEYCGIVSQIFNDINGENLNETYQTSLEDSIKIKTLKKVEYNSRRKEYEIQSFSSTANKIIYRRDRDLFNGNGSLFTYDELFSSTLTKIHSVKRLSDGEVFTIGDKIKLYEISAQINSFRLNDDESLSVLASNVTTDANRFVYNIRDCIKVKPLLIADPYKMNSMDYLTAVVNVKNFQKEKFNHIPHLFSTDVFDRTIYLTKLLCSSHVQRNIFNKETVKIDNSRVTWETLLIYFLPKAISNVNPYDDFEYERIMTLLMEQYFLKDQDPLLLISLLEKEYTLRITRPCKH